jgi:mercuric transport protein
MKSKLVAGIAAFLMIAFTSVGVLAVTKKATIKVDGMTCAKCTGSVEKALKATDGVEKVEVNLQRKEAVVEYDDEKVTEAKLREVITATGFKVVEEKP